MSARNAALAACLVMVAAISALATGYPPQGDSSGSGGGSSGDLLADGTVPLTANWDLGGFGLTGMGGAQLDDDELLQFGTTPLASFGHQPGDEHNSTGVIFGGATAGNGGPELTIRAPFCLDTAFEDEYTYLSTGSLSGILEVGLSDGAADGSVNAATFTASGVSTALNWGSGIAAITSLYAIDLDTAQIRTISIDGSSADIDGVGTNIIQVDTDSLSSTISKGMVIVITESGAAQLDLAFSASWKWLTAEPTSLTASGVGVLTITSYGATEGSVLASWTVLQ